MRKLCRRGGRWSMSRGKGMQGGLEEGNRGRVVKVLGMDYLDLL